jgi:hypothetical protein
MVSLLQRGASALIDREFVLVALLAYRVKGLLLANLKHDALAPLVDVAVLSASAATWKGRLAYICIQWALVGESLSCTGRLSKFLLFSSSKG